MQTLTLSIALWRLRLRLNRHGTFWLLVYGLLLPGALSLWAQSHAHTRSASLHVIVGTFVLGLHSILVRRAGNAVALERSRGIWTLLSTTRVTRKIYLIAQFLDMLVLTAVPMIGLAIATAWQPEQMPTSARWLLPALLACVTFGSIALLISGISSPKVVALITNLLSVSTLAFCPMLYTIDRVPSALWPFVAHLPPTLAVQAIVPTWHGQNADFATLAILAGWMAASSYAVARWFPWRTSDSL